MLSVPHIQNQNVVVELGDSCLCKACELAVGFGDAAKVAELGKLDFYNLSKIRKRGKVVGLSVF